MLACLAPPSSAPPQLPSDNRSVALGLGSARGVGSVVGGVGTHGQSSAPPLGGPGAPGGPSTPFVGLPGRRPDPDDGVTALSQFHPFLGVPPSLGDIGVHPGVSVLDMGGLGVPSARDQSPSVMGGTGVPGGTSILHEGNVGRRPDPDEGVPDPARSYHASGPRPLASPRSLRGSPVPSLVVVSVSHPSRRGASLPSLFFFGLFWGSFGCTFFCRRLSWGALLFFVFRPTGWHSWPVVVIGLLHSFRSPSSGFGEFGRG